MVEGCKHIVKYAAWRSSFLITLVLPNTYSVFDTSCHCKSIFLILSFLNLPVSFCRSPFLLWGCDLHACAAFDLVPLPSSWKPHLKSVPGKAPSMCPKPSSRPEWTLWPKGWSGGCGTTWWKGQLEANQGFLGVFLFFFQLWGGAAKIFSGLAGHSLAYLLAVLMEHLLAICSETHVYISWWGTPFLKTHIVQNLTAWLWAVSAAHWWTPMLYLLSSPERATFRNRRFVMS